MKETMTLRCELKKELHTDVRVEAVKQGVPLAKVVTVALKQYLARRSKVVEQGKGKVR